MYQLEKTIRPHILSLSPYSSARDEYSGTEGTFLDANENPLGSVGKKAFNRYPDPHQTELKQQIAQIKKVKAAQIFLGNGSDEPIDLLIRACCEPKIDNILIMPPTYGMYKVCADIQDITTIEVPLTPNFQIDVPNVLAKINTKTKILWVCSPNNPSGNLLNKADIFQLLNSFEGLVVIDEAYIDFAGNDSFTAELPNFQNLVVLQTFSKAWGLAGLRLGMAFANEALIKILNKIKYPYNINIATQRILLDALKHEEDKNLMVQKILKERLSLFKKLIELPIVQHIFPSDSNMLLVQFQEAKKVFDYLIDQKIIVRDRSNTILCNNCLRISIGTGSENKVLITALKKLQLNPNP